MKTRRHIITAIIFSLSLECFAIVAPTLAQTSPPERVPYALRRDSAMEEGCFGPCDCPVLMRGPLLGRFRLTFLHSDGLFDHYAVEDVRWKVKDLSQSFLITGSGTYRIGGEFARLHQLVLDLQVGEDPVQRFDSGLVQPTTDFPSIDARISLYFEQQCRDTVFDLHARPVRSINVDASSIWWSASPSADAHDVVRGSVTALRESGGDLGRAVQICVADDATAASVLLAEDPPAGEAWFFLLRDVEDGIAGSYDSGSPAETIFPDDAIDGSSAACP